MRLIDANIENLVKKKLKEILTSYSQINEALVKKSALTKYVFSHVDKILDSLYEQDKQNINQSRLEEEKNSALKKLKDNKSYFDALLKDYPIYYTFLDMLEEALNNSDLNLNPEETNALRSRLKKIREYRAAQPGVLAELAENKRKISDIQARITGKNDELTNLKSLSEIYPQNLALKIAIIMGLVWGGAALISVGTVFALSLNFAVFIVPAMFLALSVYASVMAIQKHNARVKLDANIETSTNDLNILNIALDNERTENTRLGMLVIKMETDLFDDSTELNIDKTEPEPVKDTPCSNDDTNLSKNNNSFFNSSGEKDSSAETNSASETNATSETNSSTDEEEKPAEESLQII
ncbi:MAG: hypothetical protein BGO90_11425 [Legionella sp. 40-6]|nr:MAG: hypothetical protein BGO90_11425 [Legionella sp. 40-6]